MTAPSADTPPDVPPALPARLAGRVIGVDFGSVRIGLAVSDSRGKIASPLVMYPRSGPEADLRWFKKLVETEQPVQFVVGLPVHLNGRESQKSREAKQFGEWLAQATGVPVVFFDERFTTREAEERMREAQLTKKRRKARVDMLAAQILLQAWLDDGGPQSGEPQSLDG